LITDFCLEKFAVVVVACLLVLYSMKQFDNLTLQHGSHARMQFGILLLQQGNSMQFEKLPLQPGSSHVAAQNYPAVCR
jgi:hypothetical protein